MKLSGNDMDYTSGLKSGSEKALNAIFDQFYRPLVYFAMRIIKDKEEAEDIVVSTFSKLWERKENLENLPKVKGFLYLTASYTDNGGSGGSKPLAAKKTVVLRNSKIGFRGIDEVVNFPAKAPAGKLIVKRARIKKTNGPLLGTTAMHLLNGDFPFEVCMAVGEFMSRTVAENVDVYFFSASVIFFR